MGEIWNWSLGLTPNLNPSPPAILLLKLSAGPECQYHWWSKHIHALMHARTQARMHASFPLGILLLELHVAKIKYISYTQNHGPGRKWRRHGIFFLYPLSVIVCNHVFTISLVNVSISNNRLSMEVARSHMLEGSVPGLKGASNDRW